MSGPIKLTAAQINVLYWIEGRGRGGVGSKDIGGCPGPTGTIASLRLLGLVHGTRAFLTDVGRAALAASKEGT